MKRIVIDVEDDIHKIIKIKAAQEGKPLKLILWAMIQKWLKKE